MFCNRIVKLRQRRQRQQGIRRLNETSIDTECDQYRAYSQSGEFLMLAAVEQGTMTTVKSFFAV